MKRAELRPHALAAIISVYQLLEHIEVNGFVDRASDIDDKTLRRGKWHPHDLTYDPKAGERRLELETKLERLADEYQRWIIDRETEIVGCPPDGCHDVDWTCGWLDHRAGCKLRRRLTTPGCNV